MIALARTQPADAQHSANATFAGDVLDGLASSQKRIPAKYFYDIEGSKLFEKITQLAEYYPTRAEIGILTDYARDIAAIMPAEPVLVEFGSGSSAKTRILLRELPASTVYVPIDVSAEFLRAESIDLGRDFPALRIFPIAADFAENFSLPPAAKAARRVGFFPGSTIGNLEPGDAMDLLRHMSGILGDNSHMIIGVDLVKDPEILDAAYNDPAGVTAAFNLNLLARANRELGADFDLAAFEHRAFYNIELSRIEMHLVSTRAQAVQLCGRAIPFAAGETIHTENSYKYTVDGFRSLARRAGWQPSAVWTDEDELFSVHALVADA